jgi:hypothetical protein
MLLLRKARNQVERTDQPPSAEQSDKDPKIQDILTRIEDLTNSGKLIEARQLILTSRVYSQSADLLLELAEIEEDLELLESALSHLKSAADNNPTDGYTVSAYPDMLARIDMNRSAEAYIDGLSDELKQNPFVRWSLGDLYDDAGWHALALDAYGSARTLPKYARRRRRRTWLRTGGPVEAIRSRLRKMDEASRVRWETFSENLALFDSLDVTSGLSKEMAKGRVDKYLQLYAQIRVTWAYLNRWSFKPFLYLLFLLTGISVFINQDSEINLARAGLLTLATAAITAMAWRVFIQIADRYRSRASLMIGAFLSSMYLAAGIFLINLGKDVAFWGTASGLALIAAVGIAWSIAIYNGTLTLGEYLAIKKLRRAYPLEAVIDNLLDVIFDISQQDTRNDLGNRRSWMWLINSAAQTLQSDMVEALHSGEPQTDTWISERAAGAAYALRALNRQISAPNAATWSVLMKILRREVAALIEGNLADLRWKHPPPPEPSSKRILRLALLSSRTIVVAATPLAALFLLEPLVSFPVSDYTWARVVAIGWAILYLLLTIDPTLNDKINTARNLINLARDDRAQRPQNDGEERVRHSVTNG